MPMMGFMGVRHFMAGYCQKFRFSRVASFELLLRETSAVLLSRVAAGFPGGRVGFIGLNLVQVSRGNGGDPSQQFDPVWQLDQVIARASANASLFTTGSSLVESTRWNLVSASFPGMFDQRQPVMPGMTNPGE